MRLAVLAVFSTFPLVAAIAAGDGPRFGAVTVDGNLVCLQMAPPPPSGTQVILVDPDSPQKTFTASVAASSRCPAPTGQGGPAPKGVQLSWAARGRFAPLIGVVGPVGRVSGANGAVSVQAPGSPEALRFRSCASSDGLHLTVWRGAPLRSPRLWHGYVYLNQDLDADCTDAETR